MTLRKAAVSTITVLAMAAALTSVGCGGRDPGKTGGKGSKDDGQGDQINVPRAETFHLIMKYPKGRYETVTSIEQQAQSRVNNGTPATMQMSQTVWITSSVEDPDPLGHTIMFSHIHRMQQSLVKPDGNTRFDTADPATLRDNPVAQTIARVFDAVKLKMYFDAKWKLVEISGMNQAWEKLAQEAKTEQEAKMIQGVKKDLGDRTFERMVIPGREYMPTKPVAVGESWQAANLDIPLPVPGKMLMTATCRLISVEPFQGDRLAVIETHFEATGTGKSQDEDRALQMSAVKMTGHGHLKLLVDMGLIVEQTMDVQGRTEITVARSAGRQFVATHFNMKTLMQAKRLPETATAPATRP